MTWEYSIETAFTWEPAEVVRDRLNAAGSDGWELVSANFHAAPACTYFYFRRPARGEAAAPHAEPLTLAEPHAR